MPPVVCLFCIAYLAFSYSFSYVLLGAISPGESIRAAMFTHALPEPNVAPYTPGLKAISVKAL
jgi:hypothetical protein